MKQVLLSLVAVIIAAGILVGMVVYSLSVIRAAQMRMLTGELPVTSPFGFCGALL